MSSSTRASPPKRKHEVDDDVKTDKSERDAKTSKVGETDKQPPQIAIAPTIKFSMGITAPKGVPPPKIGQTVGRGFVSTRIAPQQRPKPTVASVFGDDDDDEEPEEMPAEAKMRMRNRGKFTPTSAGPNSFNKTSQGFCDPRLKKWADTFTDDKEEDVKTTPSETIT
eukprot:m.261966 g.261966  ORF g.261966 m.261966 type:complete len:167 (-) comp43925_c0_seq1:90-590(-)